MITQVPTDDFNESRSADLKVSRLVHPEDLVVGDNVAIFEVSYQLGTYHWFSIDTFAYPPEKLIRLNYLPQDDQYPQTVESICLPFVLCKLTNGKHAVHDLRRVKLTRLDLEFAKAVRAAYKADKGLDKSKKKKSKKKRKHKRKKSK